MELRASVKKINLTNKESNLILELTDDFLGEKLSELKELIGEHVTIQIIPNNVQGEIWNDWEAGDDVNEELEG